MEINESKVNDINTVAPVGHIDSETAKDFEDGVGRILDGGATNLMIDFSGVEYINSAGLRVLLMAAKRLQSGSGKFVLAALNEKVMSILEVSGFDRILEIHSTTDAALSSFS